MGASQSKNVDTVSMSVKMSCGGCAKAVTNALNKVEGVTGVKTDLDKQKVYVSGSAAPQACLEAVKATGKPCSLD